MKKLLKIVILLILIVLVGMQFFAIDKTNPPIVDEETLEKAVNVPPDISMLMARSCNDCHSHKTQFPWYSYIQPVGWFVKDHIDHGKEHLNFSKFNTLDKKQKMRKLEETCDEVSEAKMPLPSYLWIHHDAVLTESEKAAICAWTKTEIEKLEAAE